MRRHEIVEKRNALKWKQVKVRDLKKGQVLVVYGEEIGKIIDIDFDPDTKEYVIETTNETIDTGLKGSDNVDIKV